MTWPLSDDSIRRATSWIRRWSPTRTTNAGGLAYDIERGILWVGEQGGLVQAHDLTAGAALIAGSGHMPFGVIDDTVDGLAFIAD